MADADGHRSGEGPPGPASSPSARGALGEGRYVLGDVLGSGGMGLVRQARDILLERDVAVKLLADNLALDSSARARFAREARAAAQMAHPNVVQVFDVGEQDGRPYIVMELITGGSLSDELERHETLDPDRVVGIAAEALSGLGQAHQVGLLHRDLKPANLLVAPDDTVKVTDFGVAQAAEDPGLTRTGMIIGTQSYLAPERLQGGPATIATDLYALGATLLELLTGRPPDVTPGAEGGTGDGPVNLPAGIDEGLALLIRRCLSRDPAQRPVSVEAALDVLATGRVAETEAAPPPDGRQAQRTAVLAPEAAAGLDRTRPVHAASAGDNTTAASNAPPVRDAAQRRRQLTPALLVVGAVVLLLLALLAVANTGGGDDGQGDEQGDEQPARGGEVEPVPRGDTPGDTADNLADWLRDNAGS